MRLNLKAQGNSAEKIKYLEMKKQSPQKETKENWCSSLQADPNSTNIFINCTVAFMYLYFKGPNYLFMSPLRY